MDRNKAPDYSAYWSWTLFELSEFDLHFSIILDGSKPALPANVTVKPWDVQ